MRRTRDGWMLLWALVVASRISEAGDTFDVLAFATRFELSVDADMRIVSDLVVKGAGMDEYAFVLSHGSRAATARAFDRASGSAFATRGTTNSLEVSFGRTLEDQAELRLRVEEWVDRTHYLRHHGAGLIFEHSVPPGRVTLLLPQGYALRDSTVSVQAEVEDGRLKAGIINPGEEPLPVRLELEAGSLDDSSPIDGDFRAEDDKNIIYWLEDPAEHRIRLALELLIDTPGQSHVFSVLLEADDISEPVTLDVDRGVELPTRIVTAEEAAALPHSPKPIPPGAEVLVAELGYAVPPGGGARVRLYQTAVNPGYELLPTGELKLFRFWPAHVLVSCSRWAGT